LEWNLNRSSEEGNHETHECHEKEPKEKSIRSLNIVMSDFNKEEETGTLIVANRR
jgi:hypothetical protein